jgi:ATP adenylyltransferase
MKKPSTTYSDLVDFIQNRMQMQQIYQPVMLMEILQRNGATSVTDIAKSLLGYDTSQAEYYEHITKNMVGKVLTKNNGVTEQIKEGRKIIGYQIPFSNELSDDEIDDLVSQCMEKVEEYISRYGDTKWAGKKKSTGYISGSIRYEVFKRAKFRCELCGISAEEKALEVDHIVPRNKNGTDDLSNLQALCYSCNASKRDRDDTDFRGMAESYNHRERNCLFCEIADNSIIASNELCYAIWDNNEVTKYHTLIIPKRHVAGFFELHQPEINAVHSLLGQMKEKIEAMDDKVSGFNVGVNSGRDAGQSILHCHFHLIPRRKGDIENPKGGVRGVIPEKRIYIEK